MPVLVDASILVRLHELDSPLRQSCIDALAIARRRPGEFLICAQTAIEFWSVATRPKNVNGLSLSPFEADDSLNELTSFLSVLSEPPDIYARWRAIVSTHVVSGKPAHDARLVALMQAHNLTDILTLNARDFARYPGIRILSPHDVVSSFA